MSQFEAWQETEREFQKKFTDCLQRLKDDVTSQDINVENREILNRRQELLEINKEKMLENDPWRRKFIEMLIDKLTVANDSDAERANIFGQIEAAIMAFQYGASVNKLAA